MIKYSLMLQKILKKTSANLQHFWIEVESTARVLGMG